MNILWKIGTQFQCIQVISTLFPTQEFRALHLWQKICCIQWIGVFQYVQHVYDNNCIIIFRCGFNSDGHDTVYDRLRTRLIPWLGMFNYVVTLLFDNKIIIFLVLLNKQLFPFHLWHNKLLIQCTVWYGVCMCACVCVCACVRACVRACVHVYSC